MICTTWSCDRPAIAQLVVRRPCGHPVAAGQPVQMQWHCAAHIYARAGRSAPGPSTCPTCGVRQPVTTDALVHAAHPELAAALCRRIVESGETVVDDRSLAVTCPACLEWLHA